MKLKLVKIENEYHLSSGIRMKEGDNGWCLTSSERLFKHEDYTSPAKNDILLIASTVQKEGLLRLNKDKIEEHLSALSREVDIESICAQTILKKSKWQHLMSTPQRPHPTFFWNEVDSTVEGYNLANSLTDKKWSDEDILKASKYGYTFRDTTSFPEQKFEDGCINNTKQYIEFLSEEKTEWDVEIETRECRDDEYCHLHKIDNNEPVCTYLKCKTIKPLLINGDFVKILSIS